MILPVFELDDIYRSAAPEAQGGISPFRVFHLFHLSASPLSRRLFAGPAIMRRFEANLRVNRRRDRSSFTVTERRTGGAECLPSFQSMVCIISPIDAATRRRRATFTKTSLGCRWCMS